MSEVTSEVTPAGILGGILIVVLIVALLALGIYLLTLVIRALRKYLKSGPVREEKKEYKKSLGEVLKTHRTSCQMTQEFVAESLGVTRQAVSKWENGTADPSTSNLLALAKLYGVSAEALLSQVKSDKTADHP
jgi:DNA-binding XRE family transcriptional regulator